MVEFCGKLPQLPEEVRAGRKYRLPTEAEWEYACRAGTTTTFHFGSQSNGREANCNGTEPYGTTIKGPFLQRPTTVGSYPANAFGLYDMHGNVQEWCAHWYEKGYYYYRSPSSPAPQRVGRGGTWPSRLMDCRSASRSLISPSGAFDNLGFRVARTIDFPEGSVSEAAVLVDGVSLFNGRPPSPPPERVALPDPMPDARFLELQQGNKSPKTRLRPKPLSELADNRIGDMMGPSLQFSQAGLDPKGNPHLLEHAAYFGFRWFELSKDAYDPDQVVRTGYSRFDISPGQDRTLTLLSDNGIIIVYTITYWDETLPGGKAHPSYRNEKEIQRYLDYARFIVRHFKGRVQYYKILNEPIAGFMVLPDYINLIRRVLPVIRQEDPKAKIVVGGADNLKWPWCQKWVLGLVASDVMPLVDAVCTSPMFGASPQYPEIREYYYRYPSLVRQMKQVAATHGFKGEWIASSMNWRTRINPSRGGEPWQYTQNVAAKYYSRAIVMHLGMDFMTCIGGGWPPIPPVSRVVQNLCTVMAGNKSANLQVQVRPQVKEFRDYSFSLPNGDRLVALWRDNMAADDDRGVKSTVIVKGFSAQKVTAIEVLHSSEQEMITETDGGDLVIRNLLVKDYPIILRLTPAF